MNKLFTFYFLLFTLLISLLLAETIEIKQDGTGNFTTIQEGIIAASDSDTVLVYPGTYYENIDYLEKSLTVASLYLIAPVDSLIDQTIIDGNQQFRCVTIDDCLNASLIGFTIQNGLACQGIGQITYGGGVYIHDVSNIIIANCKIRNNKAIYGGGIYINSSNVELTSNTISFNWGVNFGGGLNIIGNDTIIQFDEIDLNNIFLNYSGTGADLFISVHSSITEVIVDTFTINEPDYFFIASDFDYTFSCLNLKIEQIDQDLYIAPDGDDNNSGITPEDPLQTIAWTQTLIKRNDENPHTIHLAPGIYSPSLNNQRFPLNIKHGVKYIGVSPEETILDAEGQSPIYQFQYSPENFLPKLFIRDVKFINGASIYGIKGGAIFTLKANIELCNVEIQDCNGTLASAIASRDGIFNFDKVKLINNSGGEAIRIDCIYAENPNPILQFYGSKLTIQNNLPGVIEGSGGGINLQGHFNIPGDYNAKLINCEISGNHDNFFNPQTGLGGSAGLRIGHNLIADVINCTFGDNTLSHNTGCVITVNDAELNMYNSILYNNDGYSFNLWENAFVNISHSLIEGGDGNINYYYPLAVVNWLEGNLDEDPLWLGSGDYPYMLQTTSPCIDAGTLDLPPGIELPEYDLAGNPRVYGEFIDMGAYEWQGTPVENYELGITNFELNNYPNPFNPETTIVFNLPEEGNVKLEIYNIKGQKVKTFVEEFSESSNHSVIWDGNDDTGKSVSSGVYFYKFDVNGKTRGIEKMLLLK